MSRSLGACSGDAIHLGAGEDAEPKAYESWCAALRGLSPPFLGAEASQRSISISII